MEPLKILVADDEQEARELILHYLEESGIQYQVFQATNGRSALEMLEKNKPELLFLDIRMPEMSGIDVLQLKEKSELPVVIFTTAFDEYALPAFDHEATDYLLKPFEKQRFIKALDKATRYISLVKNGNKKEYLTQLSIKSGSRTIIVPVKEIDFFQASGAYVTVHTNNRSLLMNEALYELEEKLDPLYFLRVHKSVILNLAAVKEIHSLANGDFMIRLLNGKEIRGSRTYKMKIKEHFRF
jgi:two-component system, LytTR family, response regulator